MQKIARLLDFFNMTAQKHLVKLGQFFMHEKQSASSGCTVQGEKRVIRY